MEGRMVRVGAGAVAVLCVLCSVVQAGLVTIKAGNQVKFDYILKVDGQEIDTSAGRGPLMYVQGQHTIVPGLERQMLGLKVGDKRVITVAPEEGYGKVDPQAFKEIPRSQIPQGVDLKVGQVLGLKDTNGNNHPVLVSAVKEASVILNFNHPLAGKTLEFDVTVVDIK